MTDSSLFGIIATILFIVTLGSIADSLIRIKESLEIKNGSMTCEGE
jgi:hypothetical protein